MPELAYYGGKPLREKPFPTKMLGASYIGEEELNELKDVINEKSTFRHYGIGNPHKVEDFEKEFRDVMGCRYALAVSSGSAALFCAIAAIGAGPEDEIILPAFGWFSDFYAVTNMGALPVFAEIDDTMNIDPDDFKRKITSRTKAVIIVHYQGGSADMARIMQIARERGIVVIEDCAQALGTNYEGKKLGTIGDIGISSFQSNKIISCGEGGILYTDNEKYFATAVRYHDLGFVRPVFKEQLKDQKLADEENAILGMQFRMNELSGAFMLAQLRKLPLIMERCKAYHSKITDYFKDNSHFSFRPTGMGDIGITLFIRFKKNEEAALFEKCLAAEGIPIGPSSGCCNILEKYPIKSKRQVSSSIPPFGKGFAGEDISYDSLKLCTMTNEILGCYVAVAIGPRYSEEDMEDIIKAIEKVDGGLYK